MSHPAAPHEGTPLWHAVAHAIGELEASADLTVATTHARVIGRLCERLAAAGVLRDAAMAPDGGSRAGFAAFLERVASDDVAADEWQARIAMHYGDGAVEEARRQAVLLHLRRESGSVTAEQAAEYFRALARGLRGAS